MKNTSNLEPVRGLSILQPWVWAICHAGKDVENRTWWPPRWLVGKRIALHASKGFDADALDYFIEQMGLATVLPGHKPTDFQRGAIIGSALLVRATDDHSSEWFSGPPCVAFVLSDVRVCRERIPWRGALGFWKMPDELRAQVARSTE